MRKTAKFACVLLLGAAAPGLAQAQDTQGANSEVMEMARTATAAREAGNCVRYGVYRTRLNDMRTDPNHPFWKRHGLTGASADRDRILANITNLTTQLYQTECSRTAAASKISLSVAAQYMDRYIGDKTSVGVAVVPGDPAFLRSPDRADGWSAHVRIGVEYGRWDHELGLNYSHTEATGTAVEPAGGRAIGYVPGDASLGAGANFGAFGASAQSQIKLNDFSLDYKLMQDFNLKDGFSWGAQLEDEFGERSEKKLGLSTTFRIRDLNHDGRLQRTPDPDNVFVNIDQTLRTYEFLTGPAIGGRRIYNWSGFYVGAYASLQGGFMRSNLDSNETLCFACGGVTTPVNIDQSKTDFSWRTQLSASAGYKLLPDVQITAVGSLQYGTRHVIDTRQNPADSSTTIGKVTGTDWGVGGRVTWNLGQRF